MAGCSARPRGIAIKSPITLQSGVIALSLLISGRYVCLAVVFVCISVCLSLCRSAWLPVFSVYLSVCLVCRLPVCVVCVYARRASCLHDYLYVSLFVSRSHTCPIRRFLGSCGYQVCHLGAKSFGWADPAVAEPQIQSTPWTNDAGRPPVPSALRTLT